MTVENIIYRLNNDLLADPNENYDILHNYMIALKEMYMPDRFVKSLKHRHKKTKWITFGIIRSIKFRDDLYIKCKR